MYGVHTRILPFVHLQISFAPAWICMRLAPAVIISILVFAYIAMFDCSLTTLNVSFVCGASTTERHAAFLCKGEKTKQTTDCEVVSSHLMGKVI